MQERFKKAVEIGKHTATVLLFVATVGSAVYAAWLKPTDTKKTDVVYDTLKARMDVNEQYFLTALQQLAVIRADLDKDQNEIADLRTVSHKHAHTRPVLVSPPTSSMTRGRDIDSLIDDLSGRSNLPAQIQMKE